MNYDKGSLLDSITLLPAPPPLIMAISLQVWKVPSHNSISFFKHWDGNEKDTVSYCDVIFVDGVPFLDDYPLCLGASLCSHQQL